MPRAELVRKIQYKPLPSQLRFHQSKARFKIFTGPVGSGKSAALVQESIRSAVRNPGVPGLLGAPTYRMLEDVTKRALLEVLEANKLPFVHSKSNNTIYLSDLDVVIFCRSLEDPTRLVGTNLGWFGLDEQTFVREEAFLRLQARLRHPKAEHLCGFGACTARGFDWVYGRYIGNRKSDDYEAIRATPRENRYLPVDFYDQLAKSYDEKFYRQEALGEFLNIRAGRVFFAFDRTENVKRIEYDPSISSLCWSLDFNVNPMSSIIGQVQDYQPYRHLGVESSKHIRILDEISLPDANINMSCAEFVRRTEKYLRYGYRLPVWVYGDPAGNNRNHAGDSDWGLVQKFFKTDGRYELRMMVASSHNQVRDGVNAVNAALCNAAGERRLMIDPRCTELIADLEQVTWKQDSHGNSIYEIDKSDPKRTHLADSLRYFCEQVLPIHRGEVGFGQTRLV